MISGKRNSRASDLRLEADFVCKHCHTGEGEYSVKQDEHRHCGFQNSETTLFAIIRVDQGFPHIDFFGDICPYNNVAFARFLKEIVKMSWFME